ncbi:MAG: TlpA family protein disulfide reductase [Bacteroidetes bacterium]|nr:TlpA family protein disulfide reductase [Bacteroidota bacterium]
MKTPVFLLLLLSFSVLNFSGRIENKSRLVQLPIRFQDGYGSFKKPNIGFRVLGWHSIAPDWARTESPITGIPDSWNQITKRQIFFDFRQFAYQNFRQGLVSEETVKEFFDPGYSHSGHAYSSDPIHCFVNIIYGKTPDGEIRYKLDANNNLDFSDEEEVAPAELNLQKLDSLLDTKNKQQVTYQAYRNSKTINLIAPVLVLQHKGSIMVNIPVHGEATIENKRIDVSSANFGSLDFDQVAICFEGDRGIGPYKMNQFFSINSNRFQIVGVNLDKELLLLKTIPNDSLVFSGQVQLNAPKFRLQEFKSTKEISLSQYAGKFLLLNFWGSWCAPCRHEFPQLKSVYNQLDKTKIDFVGVAVDDFEALEKYLSKEPLPWKQALVSEDSPIVKDYSIASYPTTILIEPNGKVIAKNIRLDFLLDSIKSTMSRWYEKEK